MQRLNGLLFGIVVLCLASCSTSRTYIDPPLEAWRQLAPPPDSLLTARLFLVGEANGLAPDDSVYAVLQQQLRQAGDRGALVFLGNSTSCCSLPDTSLSYADQHPGLPTLLRLAAGFPGRVIFLPGHKEWGGGSGTGSPFLTELEQYIETALGRENVFFPGKGFPGPLPIELSDDVVLIALDTQWWLSNNRPYGDAGTYDLKEPSDFLLELRDQLYAYRDKRVVIAGHHPLFSNGSHGGFFSLRDHLLPFPPIGSAEPLYRRLIGTSQDLAHPTYHTFRREMLRLFASQEQLIYASAHDRSLQFFRKIGRGTRHNYLISGSASGGSFVAGGHGAAFASRSPGFMTIQFYRDHSAWLEVWSASSDEGSHPAFRSLLLASRPEYVPPLPSAERTAERVKDSTVVASVNGDYARIPGLLMPLVGSNYRSLWAAPVSVPVLDLDRTAGGLTPIKLGGDSQTTTVWLQGGNGHTYMLRSIDKTVGRAWIPAMQSTVARTMVQDQISMLHPYGALVAAPLAHAVGVLHPEPRLVYVPDDPRLGPFREEIANQVVLFEVRPDEDMSDVPGMGGATNVIGSTKLFQEIEADNDHRVAARAFVRARLLDMLLADHDRTTDNYRWAAYEPFESDPMLEGEARTQGKVYVPVARDRDAAFMKVSGLLPTLYSKLAEPAWQDFDDDYGFLKGLNKKGMPLDRRFTSALTRKDWQEIADSIRTALTDDVISRAVKRLPEPVFAQSGEKMIARLKARRDRLPDAAERYYDVLASVIDVVGSNKHERFEVDRLPDGNLEVVVYKTTKDGDIRSLLYRRNVLAAETREVRLYGLAGNDQFVIRGKAPRSIRVITVGGPGDDWFADSSVVRGLGRKAVFFDTPTGTTVTAGRGAKVVVKDDPRVNHYDRNAFSYDLTRPIVYFGNNKDDGIILGGGFSTTKHGFRMEPFAVRHEVTGDVALKTRAFNIAYRGRFTNLFDPWDLLLDARLSSPNNVFNFYGLGNETRNDDSTRAFYQARLSHAAVRPSLFHMLERGVSFRFGPVLEYTDVRETAFFRPGLQPGITPDTFDQLVYGGLEAAIALGTVDYTINPRAGFEFESVIDVNSNLKNINHTFGSLASDFRLYLSPSIYPQVTVASRIGGAHNIGSFPFFASNTLGGSSNLRGYRSTRFAGRSSLYTNLDLRIEVMEFAGQLGYGEIGVLGFLDSGRVWTDGERSSVWHRGYGGGAWFHLFNALVLTGTYGLSREEQTLTIQMGFHF